MPNWCECELTITGPVEELIWFRDGVKRSANAPYLEILASYYPIPQALVGICKGCRRLEDGTELHLWRSVLHGEGCTAISAEEERTLMRRYGATNAYDWCCTYWGSKWGDCHTTLCDGLADAGRPDSLVYVFDGAWCCPCRGFREVSRMFTLLTFSIEYRAEMAGFAGSYVCRNGEELEDSVTDTFENTEED